MCRLLSTFTIQINHSCSHVGKYFRYTVRPMDGMGVSSLSFPGRQILKPLSLAHLDQITILPEAWHQYKMDPILKLQGDPRTDRYKWGEITPIHG